MGPSEHCVFPSVSEAVSFQRAWNASQPLHRPLPPSLAERRRAVLDHCGNGAAVLKEAARILAPGGILALTDNNPQSAVIQKLPPALFTLMKSTEPHSDEYYTLDVEHTLRAAGFTHVHTESSDPRHRTVLGTRS